MSEGYLLDTSVLSLLAPGKPAPEPEFAQWLRARSERLFISAVTVAEIEQGISKLRRAGGAARAELLNGWLTSLLQAGQARILPLDAALARLAGGMADAAVAIGRHPGFPDIAIAATAKAHGLTVLTRNGKHFEPLGVSQIDPLAGLPE